MSRALVVELGKINDRMQKIEETQSQILETQSLLKQQAAVAVEQHLAQTAYLQGMQPYLEARIKDVAGLVAADVLCREHVLRKDLQTMHAAQDQMQQEPMQQQYRSQQAPPPQQQRRY